MAHSHEVRTITGEFEDSPTCAVSPSQPQFLIGPRTRDALRVGAARHVCERHDHPD